MMKSLALGNSSLRASALGYGCWRIVGNHSESAPEKAAQARTAVRAAFEAGYTLFDLADVYCDGQAETAFGQILRDTPGMRDAITLVTKGGIRRKGEPNSDSPYRYDFSAEHIQAACEASLKRLGVDTVDLYLLHRPDFLMQPQEVAQAFTRLRDAGKVREFGVSNFSVHQVELLQAALDRPLAVHQIEISLAQLQPFQDGTLDQCHRRRITPMAWSPLAGGRLANNNPIDLQDPTHSHRLMIRESTDLIARDYGVSRGVVALAWLLKHPAQIQPIVGSTSPKLIQEYAIAPQVELSRDEWYSMMEAARGERLA